MVNALIAIAAVAVIGFILVRLLSGGRSSYSARHSSAEEAKSNIARAEAYESQVNALQRRISTAANDTQRELYAKKMERMLKQKERLKVTAERLTKKA